MLQRFSSLRFSLMTTLALLTILGSAHLTRAQNSPLPGVLKGCLPTQTRPPIVRVEAIAQTRLNNQDYYLLSAYPASGPGIDLVISVANRQCKQEFFNPTGDTGSLTQVIGQDAARQLALGRYRREVRQFGKARVQQQINQAAAAPNGVFYPEDVWALRQLGFSIPTTVRVSE